MRSSILAQVQLASSSFKTVGLLADVSALLGSNTGRSKISLQNLPGAYVHLVGESAGEANDRPGRFTQLVTVRWGVMIVTRARNNAAGDKAAARVDDLLCELDEALCGFTPDGAISSMRKSRNAGRLQRWANELYFYAASYEADKRICKQ